MPKECKFLERGIIFIDYLRKEQVVNEYYYAKISQSPVTVHTSNITLATSIEFKLDLALQISICFQN